MINDNDKRYTDLVRKYNLSMVMLVSLFMGLFQVFVLKFTLWLMRPYEISTQVLTVLGAEALLGTIYFLLWPTIKKTFFLKETPKAESQPLTQN